MGKCPKHLFWIYIFELAMILGQYLQEELNVVEVQVSVKLIPLIVAITINVKNEDKKKLHFWKSKFTLQILV